jgi:hypothetical protein
LALSNSFKNNDPDSTLTYRISYIINIINTIASYQSPALPLKEQTGTTIAVGRKKPIKQT